MLESHTRNAALAFLDQAAVSAGSFATQIVIARSLAPRFYGVFALLWGAILLLTTIHNSLITYPLSVRLAEQHENNRASLFAPALVGSLTFCVVCSTVLAALMHVTSVRSLSMPVICSLVAWQMQEICRRSLMARFSFGAAIVGDFISYPGQALAIWYVSTKTALSLNEVFICMATTSILATIVQAIQLRPLFTPRAILERLQEFWQIGKWNCAGTCLSALSGQALLWVLAAGFGTSATAAVQSVTNVLGVTHPVIFGIGNVIVPGVAAANLRVGPQGASRTAVKYALCGAVLVIPYLIAVTTLPRLALVLFYGPFSPYMALALPLRIMCLNYAVIYAAQVSGALLDGLQRPLFGFWGQLGGTIAALGVGFPLTVTYGVAGAVAGQLIANLAKKTTQIALLSDMNRWPERHARYA